MNRAAVELYRLGHIPIIGVNAALPIATLLPEEERYEAIMEISLAVVGMCDAILMIGSSPGADRERDRVSSLGRPVYHRIDAIPHSVDGSEVRS
jgi:hypothetical protein